MPVCGSSIVWRSILFLMCMHICWTWFRRVCMYVCMFVCMFVCLYVCLYVWCHKMFLRKYYKIMYVQICVCTILRIFFKKKSTFILRIFFWKINFEKNLNFDFDYSHFDISYSYFRFWIFSTSLFVIFTDWSYGWRMAICLFFMIPDILV